MSDLELTPEQWRMARQAGASFNVEDPEEELRQAGEQLALDGLGPHPGDTYRNAHTGEIATVVTSTTRRKSWVTLRHSNRLTEVPLAWLGEHWLACRPDGSLW